LKTKTAIAIVLALLIATSTFIALSETQTVSAKKPKNHSNDYSAFVLTASGEAYDPIAKESVAIEISVTGSLNGNSKCVLVMHVRGGDITIGTYPAFSVENGRCIAIEKLGYANLILHVSSRYGGRDVIWNLKGELGDLSDDDSMSIEIYAAKVVLPVQGYPKLRNLSMQGEISLS
jgi:hypothetical protein